VTIDPDKIELYPRRKPSVPYDSFLPYKGGLDLVPEMACAGDGYRVHVTGLTHDERGYPDLTVESQKKLMERLMNKIRLNSDEIIEIEEENTRGADVVLVTYGIAARTSLRAMELAAEKGIKVGMLRLITVWPFPAKEVRAIAGEVKGIIVPELNLGQMVREVERAVAGECPVRLVPHAGGGLHQPEDILAAIEEMTR
jgi:2-oxoglutarate ferredoxin oxidoreductase subunit alpha